MIQRMLGCSARLSSYAGSKIAMAKGRSPGRLTRKIHAPILSFVGAGESIALNPNVVGPAIHGPNLTR